MTEPNKRAALRKLLKSGETIMAPGCYDPLGGRLIEELGFKVAYVGGFATGAHLVHTEPLLQINDQVEVADRIDKVIAIPLLADAHAGWGDALHTTRTVREFEHAGVVGMHIEDQVVPKRASYFRNVIHILPREDFITKIKYAVKAKRYSDTVIIGRTDAFHAEEGSREEAVARGKAMVDAGADMIFFRGCREPADYEFFRKALPDFPQFTVGHGDVPFSLFKDLGFNMVVYPTAATVLAYNALRGLYESLRDKGVAPYDRAEYWEIRKQVYRTVDLPGMWEVERDTIETVQTPRVANPLSGMKVGD